MSQLLSGVNQNDVEYFVKKTVLNGHIFSAYNITEQLRKVFSNVSHKFVRDIVHQFMKGVSTYSKTDNGKFIEYEPIQINTTVSPQQTQPINNDMKVIRCKNGGFSFKQNNSNFSKSPQQNLTAKIFTPNGIQTVVKTPTPKHVNNVKQKPQQTFQSISVEVKIFGGYIMVPERMTRYLNVKDGDYLQIRGDEIYKVKSPSFFTYTVNVDKRCKVKLPAVTRKNQYATLSYTKGDDVIKWKLS